MSKRSYGSIIFLLLQAVFFSDIAAISLTRGLLNEIPQYAKVAVQVMQSKDGGEDLSKKSMFLRLSDKKGIDKKQYPSDWRLSDDGGYFEVKQLEKVSNDKNSHFTFYKNGTDVAFRASNGKFLSIYRDREKKYVASKAGYRTKKKNEGTPLVHCDTDELEKWSEWKIEANPKEYGQFWLHHTEKNAKGYLNAPSGKWANQVLWTAKSQDANKKDRFQMAEKGDGLLFKIQVLSEPSTKEQIKAPVSPQSSAALQSLSDGTVVGLLPYTMDKPKYLKVDGKKLVVSNDKTIKDKECRFRVLRDGNWIGFRSLSLNKTLQGDPKKNIEFQNNNFKDHEKWSLEPVDYENQRSLVRLRSRASKGYLTIHNDGRAWTRPQKDDRPAIKNEGQLLRIVKVNEVS